MKLDIKKGMLFKCIKRVEMNGNPDDVAYWEGRVYRSDSDDCITDDGGDKYHSWSCNYASQYFVNVDDEYRLEKLPHKYSKIILKCKEHGLLLSVYHNGYGFCWTINDVNNVLFYSLINHSPFNNEDAAWYSVIRRASEIIYKSNPRKSASLQIVG